MDIPLKCSCGALRGVVHDISSRYGHRAVCMCDDCQAYAHYLGQAKTVLDVNGGTDVVPVAPANLEITHGIENLKCLRLTEKGLLRWYAGCCNTPIANTTPISKIPFSGLMLSIMDFDSIGESRDSILGPVGVRVQGKSGIGLLPERTHQNFSFKQILQAMVFIFVGFLKRQYTPSPFFNAQTGKLVVVPYILTKAERDSLRKQ